MHPRLKSFLQYIFILGITVLLIWFSLRGLKVAEGENKWDYLKKTWETAHKGWLFTVAFLATLSHVIRAERWRMLLIPVGCKVKLSNSFFSLMVGYLVNLIIPRGGEVSRCFNLFKLEKTPVEISFGTVVLERIVDVLCLLLLLLISFALESQKLFAFVDTLPINFSGYSKLTTIFVSLIGGMILFLIGYLIIKRNVKLKLFLLKIWNGFKHGLLSIFKLQNKGLFTFYSLLIWFIYFTSSYAVLKAFPSTSDLGFNAVLSLFAIGAIAMAVPLPGGTGSYHVLVPQALVFLYQIPLADAVAFTFIFHGWQTLGFIVFGSLSLVITSLLVKKKLAN